MGILNFNSEINLFNDNERYSDFKSLKYLYLENGVDAEYPVKGVYTYSSKYGESCFIKSKGYNIQLPNYMTDIIKGIREDVEAVEQINLGKTVVTIYRYELPEKYPNKDFYSVTFKLK